MANDRPPGKIAKELRRLTYAAFLESSPPGSSAIIQNVLGREYWTGGADSQLMRVLEGTELHLHCESPRCNGIRVFAVTPGAVTVHTPCNRFISVQCRNCNQTSKVFAVRFTVEATGALIATKIGELPGFGPPVPSRVITLIGPDRELFLRGRRAENQGLGIGAFAYYRRVVENQKSRLIEKIGEVAKRLGADATVLAAFQAASKETQFVKAVDAVKAAMPPVLLINGHNPLTLLHSALSEGLHADTEEECLELARHIRVVLSDLAERIDAALKDEAELQEAVTRLITKKKKAATPAPPDSASSV